MMNRNLLRAAAAMAVTLFTFLAQPAAASEPVPPAQLPRLIDSGTFPTGHIQGIAVDTEHRYIYYSYTTMLVKADMQGRVVGTVTGLVGHLGSLTFNAEDGRVYGSLEYKNDAIGRGILAASGHDGEINDGFYIAIFDVDRITRTDMSAERDGVMTAVFIGDILRDYTATVRTEQGERLHRFGCSGFDGITFGPRFGRTGGRRYLTLSYGIYDDTTRTDNDYQVLLQYDTRRWRRYEAPLSQSAMHRNGPEHPDGRYFVFTGNTAYGVQNLCYDDATKRWYMAVYYGQKPQYPNYTLFAVDAASRPVKSTLRGVPYVGRENVLPLSDTGVEDKATGIRGWHFPYGSTGLCALGDGYFYISHHYVENKRQGSRIRLYRWTGSAEHPFEQVR